VLRPAVEATALARRCDVDPELARDDHLIADRASASPDELLAEEGVFGDVHPGSRGPPEGCPIQV
jgi:hypothetical protein